MQVCFCCVVGETTLFCASMHKMRLLKTHKWFAKKGGGTPQAVPQKNAHVQTKQNKQQKKVHLTFLLVFCFVDVKCVYVCVLVDRFFFVLFNKTPTPKLACKKNTHTRAEIRQYVQKN